MSCLQQHPATLLSHSPVAAGGGICVGDDSGKHGRFLFAYYHRRILLEIEISSNVYIIRKEITVRPAPFSSNASRVIISAIEMPKNRLQFKLQ